MADPNALTGALTAKHIRAAQKLFGLSDKATLGDLKREQARFEAEYSNLLKVMEDPSRSPFAHFAGCDFSKLKKRGSVEPSTSKQDENIEKATARAIICAGETARAGGPAMPEPSGTARLILMAGKKRRGEI